MAGLHAESTEVIVGKCFDTINNFMKAGLLPKLDGVGHISRT